MLTASSDGPYRGRSSAINEQGREPPQARPNKSQGRSRQRMWPRFPDAGLRYVSRSAPASEDLIFRPAKYHSKSTKPVDQDHCHRFYQHAAHFRYDPTR